MGSTTPITNGTGEAVVSLPWIKTPLVRSAALSRLVGCNVWLKLENLQPSGSFKSRGIGNLLLRSLPPNPHTPVHFYCSSGGNAGLACAHAAFSLKRPCTIVVPMTTSSHMIAKIKLLDAEVVQAGSHLGEADAYLREELLAKDSTGVYVPPFDHPDIWEGNSGVVTEIEEEVHALGIESLDAVICSVGGGGLFNGIMQALENSGRLAGPRGTKVLAVETEGTASFHAAMKKGELVRLDGIDSIATSLGATQVAVKSLEWGMNYKKNVRTIVLGDAESVRGMVWMADEERILCESACGVSVAAAINGGLREVLEEDGESVKGKNVVIVVCGGSNISLKILEDYKERFGV
ncbi:catabolic L-serine/threonine dehydratase [Ciborinia camelliae]|nr:catabolic L-serine/threonine dehydratase [Ciborinia camelliae]